MIPPENSSDETQSRNSMFQRLNKLANTKLLKSYIAGQQLINLQSIEEESEQSLFKNQKMVKVLEDRAHKAVENIRRKKKPEEGNLSEENPKFLSVIAKKMASEAEMPSIFFP